MKITVLTAVLALAMLTAGCVNFEYQGESFAAIPESETLIYAPGTKVPAGLTVIGTAVISGDYQDVSRDRMEEKLKAEAAERGATAVRITAMQVLPEDIGRNVPATELAAEAGSLNSNQRGQTIQSEFNGGYGTASYNLLGRKVEPAQGTSVRTYRRIIRAEFLRPAAQ